MLHARIETRGALALLASRRWTRGTVACGLLLFLLSCWFAAGAARAQVAPSRLTVANSIDLPVPPRLREMAVPAVTGLPGTIEHVFADGATRALVLWVQSAPALGLTSLPPADEESGEQLAEGLLAGLSEGQRLRVSAYDPERSALAFDFEQRVGAGDGSTAFSGVAFLTRQTTVIALLAAPLERSAELRSAAKLVWEQSGVRPEARLPSAAADSSTIRMAFLQARPTRTIKPICVKMLFSLRATRTPASALNRHIGTIRITTKGRLKLS
jgi:hypothetical protein